MKFFWRFGFPVVFGLLIYASIRTVTDITQGDKFWERPWKTNVLEIAGTIVVSFLMKWILDYFIKKFEKNSDKKITRHDIFKEFLIILAANLIFLHVFVVPMIALTDDGLQLEDYVIAMIIPSLYALLYFAIVRGNQYLKNYTEQKVQLEKITNNQLQTELKFLKAQYHPHFLFNALNTVYFQMDENVNEAKKTVEKFSELLRYQLYDQQQIVPISQEIDYLSNFIDIQKVRTSEKLQLKTRFDESLNGQQVYPLLFLPLVENAFKYVGGDYLIDIDARAKADEIEFSVTNSLPLTPFPEKQNGIGLENLKRRLELLYPGKHELNIEKRNNEFKVSLKLKL